MSKDGLAAHCLELLAPLAASHGPARARRMFGGYGLYVGPWFLALIAFDTLFLKVDDESRARFEAAGCRPFVYEGKGKSVTMSYWTAPPEAMDAPEAMTPWAQLALAAAQRAALKRKPRPTSSQKSTAPKTTKRKA